MARQPKVLSAITLVAVFLVATFVADHQGIVSLSMTETANITKVEIRVHASSPFTGRSGASAPLVVNEQEQRQIQPNVSSVGLVDAEPSQKHEEPPVLEASQEQPTVMEASQEQKQRPVLEASQEQEQLLPLRQATNTSTVVDVPATKGKTADQDIKGKITDQDINGKTALQNINVKTADQNINGKATDKDTNGKTTDTDTNDIATDKDIKVAIYMTTHMSKSHKDFITKCWPTANQELELVRKADLLVYTSCTSCNDIFLNQSGFDRDRIKFHYYSEKGSTKGGASEAKNRGAMLAMVDPFLPENRWFDNYDWVIRVNPDVLIRDDKWLLRAMRDKDVDGIFVKYPFRGKMYVHSDFTVFRPNKVNATALQETFEEMDKKNHFFTEKGVALGLKNIIHSKRIRYLPNVQKEKHRRFGLGHVAGRKCDVVHVHEFIRYCPNYMAPNATDLIHYR